MGARTLQSARIPHPLLLGGIQIQSSFLSLCMHGVQAGYDAVNYLSSAELSIFVVDPHYCSCVPMDLLIMTEGVEHGQEAKP